MIFILYIFYSNGEQANETKARLILSFFPRIFLSSSYNDCVWILLLIKWQNFRSVFSANANHFIYIVLADSFYLWIAKNLAVLKDLTKTKQNGFLPPQNALLISHWCVTKKKNPFCFISVRFLSVAFYSKLFTIIYIWYEKRWVPACLRNWIKHSKLKCIGWSSTGTLLLLSFNTQNNMFPLIFRFHTTILCILSNPFCLDFCSYTFLLLFSRLVKSNKSIWFVTLFRQHFVL